VSVSSARTTQAIQLDRSLCSEASERRDVKYDQDRDKGHRDAGMNT
jgi:hypothetical protein